MIYTISTVKVYLSSDHDCEGPQRELVDPVEYAREGNVLDHLGEGLGDCILEALACSHRWMPLLLKLNKQWALGRPSRSHPRKFTIVKTFICYKSRPMPILKESYLKHLLVVYTMLGSTGANNFIRHCLEQEKVVISNKCKYATCW